MSMGIKFDEEVQALLLLLSLPDSWSGTVTTVTNSAGSDGFTFEKIRDFIFGEDVQRRSSGELSSESLYVIRGKKNIRDSGSKNKRRSQSKTRDCSSVTCWNCNEVGHFRNQCPNDKQVNIAENFADKDLLLYCANNSVDSWVMDSEALQNLVI